MSSVLYQSSEALERIKFSLNSDCPLLYSIRYNLYLIQMTLALTQESMKHEECNSLMS